MNRTREDIQTELNEVAQNSMNAKQVSREEIRTERESLRKCLDALTNTQQARNDGPNLIIEDNTTHGGSRAAYGTDFPQPMDMSVRHNHAHENSRMTAGAYSAEAQRAVLADDRTQQLTVLLNATERQIPRIDAASLRSLIQTIFDGEGQAPSNPQPEVTRTATSSTTEQSNSTDGNQPSNPSTS